MDGTVIILNNTGDTTYNQSSREFLANPIKTNLMKVIMTTSDQMNNTISVRNVTSFGSQSNRDISLRNYADAKTFNNLILEIPLNPPILLDGQTYFETDLEPFSEMDLLFYFEQEEIMI